MDYIRKNEAGLTAQALIWFLALIAVFVGLLYTVFGTVVPPDYIGVRRNYFSFFVLEEGFSKAGLRPGLHLKFPWISDIILLPRGFQFINLNVEPHAGDYNTGPLEVLSMDGARVYSDVSLIVRLHERPEKLPEAAKIVKSPKPDLTTNPVVPLPESKRWSHGGPFELITSFTDSVKMQLERIVQTARGELRSTLGELSTTDFYDPRLREWASFTANDAINDKINPYGVELWATLIRRYTYDQNSDIDDQIFAKNLQIQTEKLNAVNAELAKATAEVDKTIAFWQAKIRDVEVDGDNYRTIKTSEARFYEETKVAEGEKELRTQQAEVTEQKTKLLSELRGADLFVARDLVPLVKTLSGGIVSDLDPYDVDAWVKKLSGSVEVSNNAK